MILNLYKEENEKNILTFDHFTGISLFTFIDKEVNNLENYKT